MYGVLNDFLTGRLEFTQEAPSNGTQNPEAIVSKYTQR
jgi:hypothetical protein